MEEVMGLEFHIYFDGITVVFVPPVFFEHGRGYPTHHPIQVHFFVAVKASKIHHRIAELGLIPL